MLVEHQVGVQPDFHPSSHLYVESDEAVSYLDFGCEFPPEVILVASPACEECCLCLCSVELEISSAGPLDALCCAGFMFFDHRVQVLPGSHPSEIVYEGMAFGLPSLFRPLYQSSGVYQQEYRQYG